MNQARSSLQPKTTVRGRALWAVLACSVISACSTASRFMPDAFDNNDGDGVQSRVQSDGRVLDGRARGRYETGSPADSMRSAGNHPISAYQRDQLPPVREGHSTQTLSIANRWRPPMRDSDSDGDGVLDVQDDCPQTAEFVTVDRVGCGLFDAVLNEVVFNSGSRWLSEAARSRLDLLAETLLAFPESRVQVRAHTDSTGSAALNQQLSLERAESVVEYLKSRGVDAGQLQPVGMGESSPLASNDSGMGQQQNRRVDIVTLPDQDAGALPDIPRQWPARTLVAGQSQGPRARPVKVAAASEAVPLPAVKVDAGEPALKAAAPVNRKTPPVMPLPEPGFAPGVGISGVVEGLSFATGSAELQPEVRPVLDQVSRTLLDNPQVRIVVMAHTDDTGNAEQNLELSRQRARTVVDYLSEQGVASERLDAEGYGELLPLVQNVTSEDRARNRRVEIRIQRN